MLDLLIRNGLVFDGLASRPVRSDIAILDGKVVGIAPQISRAAKETVDAEGLWITPGFIDIHTHYDIELEIAPGLVESVRHGVTTIVMGNCSLSLAVGSPAELANIFQRVETLSPVLIQKWLASSVSWQTPREYLAHLRQLPMGPNVAALFGHSALRAHVMGLDRSLSDRATAEELEEMKRIAIDALDAGFIGISIDMVPWHMMSGEHRGRTIPSQHADYRERRMLAEVCRARDAVFQVTPDPQRSMSLVEILRISLGLFRRPLRITVLAALDSVSDRSLWRVFRPMLFVLNGLLRCNVRFQTLTEPFTIYSDGPITPLFEEFACGVKLNDCTTPRERHTLWQSPGFREKFQSEWTGGHRKTFHRQLDLMRIEVCPDARLEGKTFAEAALEANRDPVEFFIELLELYDTAIRWVATGANDRQRERLALMSVPGVLPGFTDAGAHVQNLGYYDGALSLLKQAVTTGFMSAERAVSRVTGEPAGWFRLDAGVLKEGAKADLVLINPEHLCEPVSRQIAIDDPVLDGAMRMVKRGSERILEAVYINGKLAVRRGEIMETLGQEKLGEALGLDPVKPKSRNRINDSVADHPFTDYWDIFVMKHQSRSNIALHFLGVVIFYGLLAVALILRNPWLLLLLPLSQTVGLAGHFFFERSHIDLQDAVFSFRASRCLNKMFVRIITGKYGEDIRRANDELKAYQRTQAEISDGKKRGFV
ncbi:MAG: amidohydrolase family protein [Blastocatellia bacterium]